MNNRRSTVVINSQFQYQYGLLTVTATVVLVNAFLIISACLPGSQGFSQSTGNTILIACLELVLIGGVWWGCLFASHKIAGPVYVMVRQMEKLAEGDLTARVRLRRKDAFQVEAVAINHCIEELQGHLLEVSDLARKLEQQDAESTDSRETLIKQLNQKLAVFNFQ
jgi:methyl-accepting chemotaxis protein